MYSSHKDTNQKHGFTLVELLIVIVIIGMLASLVLVAGNAAINAARRGVIKADITQLEMALELYKQKYGEYPPDFSDRTAVMRHVRKRWPRYSVSEDQFYANMVNAGWDIVDVTFQANNIDVDSVDYSTYGKLIDSNGNVTCEGLGYLGAATFWLGGLPDGAVLGGFSADVSNPFNTSIGQRELPLMEFTIGDNVISPADADNPYGVYFFRAHKQPVLYFRADYAREVNGTWEVKSFHDHDRLECAVPYGRVDGPVGSNTIWYNQDKFQLIHPGLDGVFCTDDQNFDEHGYRGIDPEKEVRSNFSLGDDDNQCNFGGTTIGG